MMPGAAYGRVSDVRTISELRNRRTRMNHARLRSQPDLITASLFDLDDEFPMML
jgi:hypothetical protein